MTTSIGRRWKCSDVCSRAVLIARKLAQCALAVPLYGTCLVGSSFDGCAHPSQNMSYQQLMKLLLEPAGNVRYVPKRFRNRSGTSSRWPWRRGPPLSIPNREVKPVSADGTATPGGRVGRRLPRSPSQK